MKLLSLQTKHTDREKLYECRELKSPTMAFRTQLPLKSKKVQCISTLINFKMGLDGCNQLGREKAFWLERDASMEEVIVGQAAEMVNLNF
ncbi:hypothetical protein D5086_013099 [Populus alba]|uniref:Uncharacterized protein n=1 Tax=Populus alba TaxID=43335 RepID=A0ACC4C5W3_POPAL